MPDVIFSDEVSEFIAACYASRLVLTDFDWQAWQDEETAYEDHPEKVDSADLETLLRLLTTHLRADRFCEGHLLGMFESGHIVRFLRRLKELEDEYD